MPDVPCDEDGEARIRDEIVVDAYSREEQAASWYSYLHNKLDFSLTASYAAARATSPLRAGDEVEIAGKGPEEEHRGGAAHSCRWLRTLAAFPCCIIWV